jgi:hypothetical protein
MPMRAEPGIQERTPPRAQAARVVVGVAVAIVLGAGPAIAWDVSTQAPQGAERRHPPQGASSGSPWRMAGHHVKEAVGGIARVYLPLPPDPQAVASPVPVAAPTPLPSAHPAPRASVAPALLAPMYVE